jgi:periplasmic divalent cation tolerance protein
MTTDDEIALVYSTYPSAEVAQAAARNLIASRTAACVNLIPGVQAVYEWEGQVEQVAEVILIAKVRAGMADKVMDQIKRSHPYETPAILVLPVAAVSADYHQWLLDQTA